MTMFIKLPYHNNPEFLQVIDLSKVRFFEKIDGGIYYVQFYFDSKQGVFASFSTSVERDEFYNKICNLIITDV